MDGDPNPAHDRRAIDPQAQQSGGEQERLGQPIRKENRLKPGTKHLHAFWFLLDVEQKYSALICNCYLVDFFQTCINEWHMMADLLVKRPVSPDRISLGKQESSEQVIRAKLREIMKTADLDTMTSKVIRIQLENQMERNLETFKSFIDKEILVILGQMDPASRIQDYLYLGSEWNASNLEELSHNGITHILNVTREIDNFFPGNFRYLNVRVYDEEATDLVRQSR